jgi:hypothetical protein
MKALLAALAALAITGCSTTLIPDNEAKLVTTVASTQLSLADPSKAAILLKRDKGEPASTCTARFFIDGQHFVDMDEAQKAVAYVEPGDHVVEATLLGPWCGKAHQVAGITVHAAHDKMQKVRMYFVSNLEIHLANTAF